MEALNHDNMPTRLSVPLIGRDKMFGVLNVSKFIDPSSRPATFRCF
jgi:hypothetical protein